MKYPDIDEHAKSAEKVWGEAYDILWPIINAKNFKIGAEIGVAFGGHSERILSRTKVQLYCVDPYRHFEGYEDSMNISNSEFNRLYKYTESRLTVFGDRVHMIRQTSESAAKTIKQKLDFVYIDADHSKEGVKKDILTWFPKIIDGGVIAGHDYNHPNFPGIKEIVDKFFSRFDWEIHSHSSGVWWVEKKPLNISYIMPAFNSEKTIKESVSSIYKYNFVTGDELIIVDDNSSDNTRKVIQNILKKFANTKSIFLKYHKGGGNARNIAIENAKHELIFCLDSDNILKPHSVRLLKEHLIISISDISSFSRICYFNNNTSKISHTWKFSESIYNSQNYLKTKFVPGASGNYLYTKNSWIIAGMYPVDTYMDTWGFGLRQVMSGSIISILPKSFYLHRVGQNSYWQRESKIHNPSLTALQLVLPYYDNLKQVDINRIMSKKYRKKWLDCLGTTLVVRPKIRTNNRYFLYIKNLMAKFI